MQNLFTVSHNVYTYRYIFSVLDMGDSIYWYDVERDQIDWIIAHFNHCAVFKFCPSGDYIQHQLVFKVLHHILTTNYQKLPSPTIVRWWWCVHHFIYSLSNIMMGALLPTTSTIHAQYPNVRASQEPSDNPGVIYFMSNNFVHHRC